MGRERKSAATIDEEPDEDSPAREEAEPSGAIQDVVRKMMGLGLAGFFTTEATIRGALGDTVPREWTEFVSQQSERTREEFARRMADEFARVLSSVDLAELAEQLLEGRSIEVKAEFKLGPRDTQSTEARPGRGKNA